MEPPHVIFKHSHAIRLTSIADLHCTKKLYSHELVRRLCILFFYYSKLKNSRYFYIIKSSVSLCNRTANKYLISQFCARLECQASSRYQLAGRGYTLAG